MKLCCVNKQNQSCIGCQQKKKKRFIYHSSLEIKPVNPKGNQPWIVIGRTDAEAETPILWPPDAKNWLTGKEPDAGKDWRREEKGVTEAEMVGWHHQLDGHEFEQAPRVSDGQGSLACCRPRGRKESDTLSDWTAAIITHPISILQEEFTQEPKMIEEPPPQIFPPCQREI